MGKTKTDSILISIKKMLGLDRNYNAFDQDIIIHINSVFLILNQLGVGPDEVFSISDETTNWEDFLQGESIGLIKSYMYLKVRLLFDPPSTGVLHQAMERQISEFEWRLNIYCDTPKEESETGGEADESKSVG